MDNLNKQQVILLAMLVSFITAVSTGITTVSLMDKSEDGVPQTIYRVVEKTIEKVIEPSKPEIKIIEKEAPKQTVLSVADIAEKASVSFVRVYEQARGSETLEFKATGLVIGDQGKVLVPDIIEPIPSASYFISKEEGKFIPVTFDQKGITGELVTFIPNYPEGVKPFIPYPISQVKDIKIGVSVIALGGKEKNNVVSTGIVKEQEELEAGKGINIIITDINPSDSSLAWTLFGTDGKLIGFYLARGGEGSGAKYVDALKVAGELVEVVK